MKKIMLVIMLLCFATLFEAAAQNPTLEARSDTITQSPQYPIVFFYRGDQLLLSLYRANPGRGGRVYILRVQGRFPCRFGG